MPEPDRSLELLFEEIVEGRMSRRQALRRLGAAGFAMSSAGTLLAACGGTKGTNTNDPTKAVSGNHPKTKIGEIDFSNWQLYIDKATIPDFEKQYPGSKVKYTEDINDNEEFFGKVRQQLQRGDSIDRDIVALTDWMAARWIRAGWVEPLDKRNIPNFKNLQDNLKSPKFDPHRSYSLPWQSGMTAIGYNRRKTGRDLTSINDLFDPKFKGRVSLLTDPRDSAGLVMIGEGKDMNSVTLDDARAAIAKIDKANRSGQIRSFTGNDYTSDLTQGNLWVSVAYSGDVIQLQADNPDLKFVIPDEGAILWTDNMMLPQKPPHPYAAETFMNFVYEPKIAAQIAAEVNYVTPVKGAQEELAKIDPKLASNPLIFPSDADRAKLQPYPQLSPEDERTMVEEMQKVTGA
ncbi:MAG: spermidine/putrescine transport system substrate-binding protein [Thermoleophilaceae bacterium]|nr:spermidine/putrescine transport system substrate-binding protein [Thermoleophilaceae bacterium]